MLAVCRHDKTFALAFTGGEGSIHDANLMRIVNLESMIPAGYYILFDAAAPLTPKVLTPYRSTRYHLAQFSTTSQFRAPETYQEAFNLRHARKRCRIEIAFAFLKLRFRITSTGLQGSIQSMMQKLDACVFLHNFIQSRFGRFDTVTSIALQNALRLHDLALIDDDDDASAPSTSQTYRDDIAHTCFTQPSAAPSVSEVIEAAEAATIARENPC
jgi:hypothetical protein